MKDSRTKPFLLALFTYFVVGSMVLTTSTVMKSIIKEFAWSDAQGGLIVTCMSGGFLVMSVLGNMLVEKIGRRLTILIGSGIIIATYLLFALSPVPELYYPLMAVAGLAWGALNGLVNTLVSELYDGDSSHLQLLNACYAVGAVLLPLFVGLTTMNGMDWRVSCYVIVALGVLLLISGLLVKLPPVATAERKQSGSAVKIPYLREIGFYISVIVFFVYVGVEVSAQSWLSNYLSQANTFFKDNVPSETMVSLMWGMLLAGRLLFSVIGSKFDRRILLICLSCGFLLGLLGVILLAENTVLAIASVVVLGLSMSAMYGTAVANAQRYVTGSAVAAGWIFGAASFGSTLMPLLAGAISDASQSLKTGMFSLCGFLVLLIGATVVNMMISRKKS